MSDKYTVEYLVEQALRDEPLDDSLVLELLTRTPLHVVIRAAEIVKEKLVGRRASYVVNVYVAYTNVCIAKCPICNFYARSKNEEYTLTSHDVLRIVSDFRKTKRITEVHITGGLNPSLPPDYYTDLVRLVKSEHPEVRVKAYTAEEIHFIATRFGESIEGLLAELRDAGLDAMPGGGAEILDEDVRAIIAPRKAPPHVYLRIHEAAHRLGIKSNITMLYGHVEQPEHIVKHLRAVYELQGKTNGFISFIPLRWNPGKTALASNPTYSKLISTKNTGLYDLRIIAVSRLALAPRIRHIVAYWVSLGREIASLALRAGADDIGGTFYNEPVITSAKGSKHNPGIEPEELEYLIAQVGLEPVERDTFYEYLGRRSDSRAWRRMPWLLERIT